MTFLLGFFLDWIEITIICLCVCISLYMILYYIRILLKRFAIPVEGAVTGKFERSEDLTTGVASGSAAGTRCSRCSVVADESRYGSSSAPSGSPSGMSHCVRPLGSCE